MGKGSLETSTYITIWHVTFFEKKHEKIALSITQLADTDPVEVPEKSKFLLELDPLLLTLLSIKQKQYWVAAVLAALITG